MTPTPTNPTHPENVKIASGINLLVGLWFFVSPWVYSTWHLHNSWNYWIIGGLIALFAAVRVASPEGSAFFGWMNVLFGIWAFASPWIFAYTASTGRFVNSLCVGVVVFILAIASLKSTPRIPAQRPS